MGRFSPVICGGLIEARGRRRYRRVRPAVFPVVCGGGAVAFCDQYSPPIDSQESFCQCWTPKNSVREPVEASLMSQPTGYRKARICSSSQVTNFSVSAIPAFSASDETWTLGLSQYATSNARSSRSTSKFRSDSLMKIGRGCFLRSVLPCLTRIVVISSGCCSLFLASLICSITSRSAGQSDQGRSSNSSNRVLYPHKYPFLNACLRSPGSQRISSSFSHVMK